MADLAVINAVIFDGVSAELTSGTIHISGGMIVDIGDTRPEAGCEVVDARGGTVAPGLIDAHFHAYAVDLDGMTIEASPLSYVALVAGQRLQRALSRGFTTVRDVAGGDPGLARAIERGVTLAPRYLYSGAALSQTGGHGDPRPRGLALHACAGPHMTEVVDGVDELRRVTRERLRQGAHVIKIFTSGGVISPTDPLRNPQYSADEVRAVTEEAARRDSYVAAHAYSPEAIVHSVENGVRSIEHANLLDVASAAAMAERGAFMVPTLAAYDALDRRGAEFGLSPVSQAKNNEVLTSGRRAIEIARGAGVPICWGSDLMGVLEDEQLNGLRAQHEVEGTLELLRSVTSVNARLIKRDDLGRVAVGARGDLVIYAGDLFADPSLLWDAEPGRRTVIRAGQVVCA